MPPCLPAKPLAPPSRTSALPLGTTWRYYVPIIAVEAYLWGTFILFLLGPHIKESRGLALLCLFVTAAHLSLFAGYRYGLSRLPPGKVHLLPPLSPALLRNLVAASAVYHILFGAALLSEYGCTDPAALLRTVLNPGEAYFAKFQVYEDQMARMENPNSLVQVLTLTHVLSYFLIPCSVVYWRRLAFWVKGLVITGIGVYAAFFAFIGTQKGLADIVILGLGGYLVRRYGGTRDGVQRRGAPRRLRWALALGGLGFLVYMSQNQLDRLRQWDGEDRARYAAEGSIFSALLGEELGFRVSLVTSYPTHGYCGLSHSLQMPFVWTRGLGSSRALNAYLTQYLGVPDEFPQTYLARAEAETGWPALMNWSTIYPWLASDLTFPGTLGLLFVVGWLAARVWYDALRGDLLALIILSQFIVVVLYLPANNQLLQSRTGLCGTATLALWFVLNRLHRRLHAARQAIPRPRLVSCGRV